jgi:hypothetical protein
MSNKKVHIVQTQKKESEPTKENKDLPSSPTENNKSGWKRNEKNRLTKE